MPCYLFPLETPLESKIPQHTCQNIFPRWITWISCHVLIKENQGIELFIRKVLFLKTLLCTSFSPIPRFQDNIVLRPVRAWIIHPWLKHNSRFVDERHQENPFSAGGNASMDFPAHCWALLGLLLCDQSYCAWEESMLGERRSGPAKGLHVRLSADL